MNNSSKNLKNCKKYSSLKNCKRFGCCVSAVVLSVGVIVGGTANVAYATLSDEPHVENGQINNGYRVRTPGRKRYVRNDEVESHEPVLKTKGHDGITYILKDDSDEAQKYFTYHPMEHLFKELYLKAELKAELKARIEADLEEEAKEEANPEGYIRENYFSYDDFVNSNFVDSNGEEKVDGEPEDKYVRADADTLNLHAGEVDPETGKKIPKVSIINPKYPHRIDDNDYDKDNDGRIPYNPDGDISPWDYTVIANKEITVDENSTENVVNDDGSIVLSKYYSVEREFRRINNEKVYTNIEDDIYEVGTKPRIVTEELPSPKRYVKDDTKEKGTPNEEVSGTAGTRTTTTTYEVNPNTGEVTENTGEPVEVKPTETIVKVFAKDKVVTEELPVVTEYVDDPTLEEDREIEVTKGEPGEKTIITTYTVNEETGEITETTSSEITKEIVKRTVKRGTKAVVTPSPEVATPTDAVGDTDKTNIEAKEPKKDTDKELTPYYNDGDEMKTSTTTNQSNVAGTSGKGSNSVVLNKKTTVATVPVVSAVTKEKVQAENGNGVSSSFVDSAVSTNETKSEEKHEEVATVQSENGVENTSSKKIYKKTEVPKTGDSATIIGSVCLELLAILSGLLAIIKRRKENE